MDETTAGSIFSKMVIVIFILAIVDLVFINWWVLKRSGEGVNLGGFENRNYESASGPPLPSGYAAEASSEKEEKADPSPSAPPVAIGESTKETVIVQTPYKEIF